MWLIVLLYLVYYYHHASKLWSSGISTAGLLNAAAASAASAQRRVALAQFSCPRERSIKLSRCKVAPVNNISTGPSSTSCEADADGAYTLGRGNSFYVDGKTGDIPNGCNPGTIELMRDKDGFFWGDQYYQGCATTCCGIN
jgi:hypothetical protein